MVWADRALVISPYYFGLCRTPEAFARELKRLNVPESQRPAFMGSAHANATTHYFEQKTTPMRYSAIVCICPKHAEGRSVAQIHALLVHEAVHVWQSIKECLGERAPSKEFEAYSIQSIAEELMTAWGAKASRSRR